MSFYSGSCKLNKLAATYSADGLSRVLNEKRVEIVMAFEEEFSFEIPDNEAEKIDSIKSAVDFIASHPQAKQHGWALEVAGRRPGGLVGGPRRSNCAEGRGAMAPPIIKWYCEHCKDLRHDNQTRHMAMHAYWTAGDSAAAPPCAAREAYCELTVDPKKKGNATAIDQAWVDAEVAAEAGAADLVGGASAQQQPKAEEAMAPPIIKWYCEHCKDLRHDNRTVMAMHAYWTAETQTAPPCAGKGGLPASSRWTEEEGQPQPPLTKVQC
ncbi:hypothetical protein ZWY2020_008454 [Hordeum vulgare]|nr:hypothetical protein ZWY2020_008454 [Hordeum vulgare]